MKTKSFITSTMKALPLLRVKLLLLCLTPVSVLAQNFPSPYCNISTQWEILPITSVKFGDHPAHTSSSVIDGTPGLEDFTSTVFDARRGEEITLTVKGNTGGPFEGYFSFFIDWNQNDAWNVTGVTIDPDERYYFDEYIYNSTGEDAVEVSFTFTVPEHAKLGNTRMRIIFNDTAANSPCNTRGPMITYGQAEDYTINVTPDCSNSNVFTGLNGSAWENAANWTNGIPTLSHCVTIPSGTDVLVNSSNAQAKILNIENGGELNISGSGVLRVTDYINNQSSASSFVIEDGGQLIQVNSIDPNFGQYTVLREFNFSEARNQFNFVISPAIGQVIQTIYPGNPSVTQLVESENWFYNAPNGGEYIGGKGYTIREAPLSAVPSSSVIAEFVGEIPNGGIIYTVEKALYGVNLVGNPYPSNINSTAFYNDNATRIESDIYFWDNRGNIQISQQGSDYDGINYATLNALTGIGTAAPGTAGMSQRVPTNVITVGTAFLVEAKSSGQLRFNNDQRITSGSGPSFYGRPGELEEEVEKDVFWLTLETPTGMETMTAVAYFEGGNNAFYADDSQAFNISDEIYSIIDDQQVIIQGKSAFTPKDRIPLGVRMYNSGKHVIALYDTQGIFSEEQAIYIRDKKAKIVHNLSEGPYKFASESGEINDRFEIIYRNLNFTANSVSIFNKVEITQERKEIVVQSSEEDITQVEIFDLNGKSLHKSKTNSLEVRIPIEHIKKQILIIHAETASGEIISKKLIN